MLSTKKIFFFFSLFLIISCDSSVNDYKRVRGNALGTTYSVIIETEEKESLIREKIDSIFEVINSSMSTYIDNSVISLYFSTLTIKHLYKSVVSSHDYSCFTKVQIEKYESLSKYKISLTLS